MTLRQWLLCVLATASALAGGCETTGQGGGGREPGGSSPVTPGGGRGGAWTGVQQVPRLRGPTRAVWVTRYDYKTPADIRQIMDNCRAAGLNTVFFQVRGHGTVFYRSAIEPWGEELGGRDPGFDPLAVAVAEAHARGLGLHAWVNVMPGWRGPNPPQDPRQLYNARPEWFWYDQKSRRQPLVQLNDGKREGWYVSVNPCLPEVRQYLVGLFEEIVRSYDIDGLHLDYIRFPNETAPKGVDYPHDPRTLALYRGECGRAPRDDKALWAQWRTDQVSAIVRDTRAMMRRVRPGAKLSASVIGDPAQGKSAHFQDGETWVARSWVDFLCPMVYTSDEATFVQRAQAWRARAHGKPVVVGLGLYMHKTADQTARQLQHAERWRQGFALFAYASLFPSVGERQTPNDRWSAADQQRRDRVAVVQRVAERMVGG